MRPRVLRHDIAGTGDPLILVPGGLTGWLSWIPHRERLSARYRVIRVQPIHNELGTAGRPGDPSYTRDTARESLLLTMDQLGIDRADFAGWSAGGKALIDFTVAHPERVRSLTLVEPAAYWLLGRLGEMEPELEAFVDRLHGFCGTVVSEDDLALFLAAAGFADTPEAARTHPYWERAVPHRMALSWLSQSLMESDCTVGDVAGISCPVLLTKGTTTVPWEQRVVDALGEVLPDARVVELDGAHAHHIDSIDRFIDELEAHLAAGRAAGGARRTGR